MGGEQYPVLIFGSKESHSFIEWIDIFDLKNDSGEHDEYDDLLVGLKNDSGDEYDDLLVDFLISQNLSMAFNCNCDWSNCSIGIEVDNYETFDNITKAQVYEFCNKYNLSKPTFYAGINGELE